MDELRGEVDVTCMWGDDEGGRVEEGGIGEDGGSEFLAVVSEVSCPSETISYTCLSLSLLCRTNEVNEKNTEPSPVNKTHSAPTSPKYGQQIGVNTISSETGKVIGSLV